LGRHIASKWKELDELGLSGGRGVVSWGVDGKEGIGKRVNIEKGLK